MTTELIQTTDAEEREVTAANEHPERDETWQTMHDIYATLEVYSNGFRNLEKFHTAFVDQTGRDISLDELKEEVRERCPKVNFWDITKGGLFVTPSGETIENVFRANELQDNRPHPLSRLSTAGMTNVYGKTSPSGKSQSALSMLIQFAYFQPFGKVDGLQKAVNQLADKALPERWNYGNGHDTYHPILRNYLLLTFQRLMAEDEENLGDAFHKTKIRESADGLWAIFNTGLVDRFYEPIYALFCTNPNKDKQRWKFDAFVSSTDLRHQDVVRIFGTDLPETASYYSSASELVYDVHAEIGSYNWQHFFDHCSRMPLEFLRENISGFDFTQEPKDEHFYSALTAYINNPANVHIAARLKSRIKDAIAYAIKRVRWNYRTAIPIYYPTLRRISLLLPLRLLNHNEIDTVLVLEATPSGAYIAHTILSPEMAYTNARLITRLDSDWLLAEAITPQAAPADESMD